MRDILIALAGCMLIFGCASRVTSTGTSGTGKYSEDLSVWRPDTKTEESKVDTTATRPEQRIRTNQYVDARLAVNDQINTVLDSIHQQNISKGYVDGYTIQVYSGTKREDALNVKKKMTQSLPDLPSEVEYRQPNFRVRSGKYFTRLEAQQDYLEVKRHFPNAIVIPDRIETR
ncbi:MAG TPA: SPOR domain-containing protein [Chryseosolibacter sp.]|nr:SPOR domain-containing protein [Chryseosolibacter sp.]